MHKYSFRSGKPAHLLGCTEQSQVDPSPEWGFVSENNSVSSPGAGLTLASTQCPTAMVKVEAGIGIVT